MTRPFHRARASLDRTVATWRSHLLVTFSGNSDGKPAWVDKIAEGDDAGFFGPGSAAWAVHGGIPTLVAGIRALLMQTLHPGAMAGVHDWSRYREDPLGRLSGTIQWLVTVTFADTAVAVAESSRVGRFHDRVVGEYTDARGVTRPYAAGDAELLSWVHVVFTDAFLRCHELWAARYRATPTATCASGRKPASWSALRAPHAPTPSCAPSSRRSATREP